MAKNSGQQDQPKKKRKGLKRLGAAFAAAVVIGGSGWTGWLLHGADNKSAPANNNLPQNTSTVQALDNPTVEQAAEESDVVKAFNESAERELEWSDPQRMDWQWMLARQKKAMENPEYAQVYKEFLSQFDVLRGLSLVEQAKAVNKIINDRTQYILDEYQYGEMEYWAAPIETVVYGRGDCEDYAILEMDIMRYLGVDESRMYLASVNAEGDPLAPLNHAILLLNVAPEGQPQDFLIMSNMTPVLPDENDILSKTWPIYIDKNPNDNIPGRTYPAKFVLINARNLEGYWEVNPDVSKLLASNAPKPGKHAPKLG